MAIDVSRNPEDRASDYCFRQLDEVMAEFGDLSPSRNKRNGCIVAPSLRDDLQRTMPNQKRLRAAQVVDHPPQIPSPSGGSTSSGSRSVSPVSRNNASPRQQTSEIATAEVSRLKARVGIPGAISENTADDDSFSSSDSINLEDVVAKATPSISVSADPAEKTAANLPQTSDGKDSDDDSSGSTSEGVGGDLPAAQTDGQDDKNEHSESDISSQSDPKATPSADGNADPAEKTAANLPQTSGGKDSDDDSSGSTNEGVGGDLPVAQTDGQDDKNEHSESDISSQSDPKESAPARVPKTMLEWIKSLTHDDLEIETHNVGEAQINSDVAQSGSAAEPEEEPHGTDSSCPSSSEDDSEYWARVPDNWGSEDEG